MTTKLRPADWSISNGELKLPSCPLNHLPAQVGAVVYQENVRESPAGPLALHVEFAKQVVLRQKRPCQGHARAESRRGIEREKVAQNHPAVAIDDQGQPRISDGLSLFFIDQTHLDRRVIGLDHSQRVVGIR